MTLTHYRIDRDHSNSYAAWLAMGAPIAPSDGQREALLKAAQLAVLGGTAQRVSVTGNRAELNLRLPRQGVSLTPIRDRQKSPGRGECRRSSEAARAATTAARAFTMPVPH